MATFQEDSSDDEIGVNLQLAERLSINRGDHVISRDRTLTKKDHKQLCNQRKKKLYRDDQSSSSSSLEMQNHPSSSRLPSVYGLHNKKRQNGDKNIEQLANPKRTCLSDRLGASPKRKDKSKITHKDVKHMNQIPNFSSQPLDLTNHILPENTYEKHLYKFSDGEDSDFEPWGPFTLKKNLDEGEMSRTLKRQGPSNSEKQPVPENQATDRFGVQFIDSTSDDDSRTVRQNGALKGGRQSPDPIAYKKVMGRKVKKIIDSDDTDDDSTDWQVNYRSRPLLFSSSESEDSGPSNKVNKKSVDAALKKSANLSFPSRTAMNLRKYRDSPDADPLLPPFDSYKFDSPSIHIQPEPTTSSYRGENDINKPYKTRSSNRTNGQPFLDMPFQNFDSYLPEAGGEVSLPRKVDDHLDYKYTRNNGSNILPSRQYQDSTKSSNGRSCVSNNLEQERPPFLQANTAHYSRNERSPARSCNMGTDLFLTNVPPIRYQSIPIRPRITTIPQMARHRRTRSSKFAKGRSMTGVSAERGKSNLSARYPDLFDAEDSSEVEFFTANSYSDTESNTESLTSLRRANVLRNQPDRIQEVVNTDSINVGSSEDEISVVFTSAPQPARNSEQRRGNPRTLGRRCNRGSRRHTLNTQDVVSLSPDPVEQVRQMEEDERFARMLQAQFDAETDPTYTVALSHQSSGPCQISSFRAPSSSDDESIDMDMEVYPDISSSTRFIAMDHYPFNLLPIASRRAIYRNRRADTRRGRFGSEDISRFFHTPLGNLLMDSSDDSYEAFLGIADLHGDVTRGLQKGEINRLPTRKYLTPNGASSSAAELPHKRAELNKECQVCLTDYVNGDVLRILPCFHEFHTPCIDPWLKINHTCPVCRVVVDLGEYE